MEFFRGKRSATEGGFEPLPFLEWMRTVIERPQFVDAARKAVARAEELAPSIALALRAPQGAPDHSEGSTSRDHVMRMFTALNALAEGAPIQTIEEFDSHPQLAVDLDLILHTLEEHYATLAVFTLLHDIGRKDALRVKSVAHTSPLTAPFERARREKMVLGESEYQLYGKLERAVRVELGDVREEEIMARLYDRYGLTFEALDHEKWFVNDESVRVYEPLFAEYRLTPRDIQHLKFLIRYHVIVGDVGHHRGVATLALISQGALAHGIDGNDARDLLLCALFLNDICGKIIYSAGRLYAQTDLLLDFVRAEEAGFLEHRQRKHADREQRTRTRMKDALAEVGLTVDGLMSACQVPYTAARDAFARQIYAYLENAEAVSLHDLLGAHSEQFAEQLVLAKERFDESA